MKPTASPSNTKQYKDRPPGSVPTNIVLSREADAALRQFTESNPRGRGRFLDKLILEYVRRQDFRDFLREDMSKAMGRLSQQIRKDMRREGRV